MLTIALIASLCVPTIGRLMTSSCSQLTFVTIHTNCLAILGGILISFKSRFAFAKVPINIAIMLIVTLKVLKYYRIKILVDQNDNRYYFLPSRFIYTTGFCSAFVNFNSKQAFINILATTDPCEASRALTLIWGYTKTTILTWLFTNS